MASDKSPVSRNKSSVCPICGKPADAAYAPFCSRRCADVDLHRWLEGAYSVPAVEDESGAAETDEE